jgi:5-formyltetrahydrofolate cyclo-ligase
MSLEDEKSNLRQQALARRAACDPSLGAAMAAHLMREAPPPAGAIVAGFISLPGEISSASILTALAADNFQICLPYTPKRGEPLTFRTWRPGEHLVPGRFGTMHAEGPELVPDFILIPLLAFDAAGNRLGYGGGYYDRTLAALPNAYRLGLAFADQEFENLPAGPTDIRLHAVATERGVFKFPGLGGPFHSAY